jgi:polyketide cyclase/dehydrase/lipid transport protein
MDKPFDGFVSASALIAAPAQQIYSILSDYRTHHPRIVPKQYFTKLEVEEGGMGAGTLTRLDIRVLGTKKTVRHIISEPEPGRVLVETDVEGSTVTTFTVESVADGAQTRLTISTRFRTDHRGLAGKIERMLTLLVLKRIYRLELANIAAYASDLTAQ